MKTSKTTPTKHQAVGILDKTIGKCTKLTERANINMTMSSAFLLPGLTCITAGSGILIPAVGILCLAIGTMQILVGMSDHRKSSQIARKAGLEYRSKFRPQLFIKKPRP